MAVLTCRLLDMDGKSSPDFPCYELPAAVNANNVMTLSWQQRADTSGLDTRYLLLLETNSASDRDAVWTFSGEIYLECRVGGSSDYVATGFVPTVGVWYHIVFVRRSAAVLQLWINGSLVATSTADTSGRSSASLYQRWGGQNNFGAGYDGAMAQGFWWDGLDLSEAQIIAQGDSADPVTTTNLESQWPISATYPTQDIYGVADQDLIEHGIFADDSSGPDIGTSDVVVTPGVATLTLTEFVPSVKATENWRPGVLIGVGLIGEATIGDGTETSSGNVTVTPGVATLTLTEFVPVVTAPDPKTVTPGVVALVTTELVPVITTSDNKTVTPGVATVTTTEFVPVITTTDNKVVTPGVVAMVTTEFVPVVTGGGSVTVVPGVTSLVKTDYPPVVHTGVGAVPGPTSLILTEFAPVVTTTDPRVVVPGTDPLVLALYAPDVRGGAGVSVVPGTAHLVTTTFAPSVAPSTPVSIVTAGRWSNQVVFNPGDEFLIMIAFPACNAPSVRVNARFLSA